MTARSGCSSGMCTCKKKKGEDLKAPKHPQRDESSQAEAEPACNELVRTGQEEDTPGQRCDEHELSLLIRSMSVYIACLSCVHSRNRRWALLPEQIPVASGRASSWRVLDELADGTSQFAGLVFGDEGVAVGDLDQAPMWEQLSKHALPTLAPLHELAHHEDHACGSQEKPRV